MARKRKPTRDLGRVNLHAAGVDIDSTSQWVANVARNRRISAGCSGTRSRVIGRSRWLWPIPVRSSRLPRRKTELSSCQWSQQLHSYGLLQPTVIPDAETTA